MDLENWDEDEFEIGNVVNPQMIGREERPRPFLAENRSKLSLNR